MEKYILKIIGELAYDFEHKNCFGKYSKITPTEQIRLLKNFGKELVEKLSEGKNTYKIIQIKKKIADTITGIGEEVEENIIDMVADMFMEEIK
mgnify:CR=1 FL=1